MHPVDSNEISFMIAGRQAFSQAFKEAGPKILEPIYEVEVYVPGEYMGDVMSDLQGRRGFPSAEYACGAAPQSAGQTPARLRLQTRKV